MIYRWTIVCALLGLVVACDAADSPEVSPTPTQEEVDPTRSAELRLRAREAGLIPLLENPVTSSPALVEIGEALFFDPVLGGELDVACSTCHHPTMGFADGVDFPIGVAGEGLGPDRHYPPGAQYRELGELRELGRSSPTLMNLAILLEDARSRGIDPPLTWDGRTAEFGGFSRMPMRVRDEMRGDEFPQLSTMDVLLERLDGLDWYRSRFTEVFPEVLEQGIELHHFTMALSAYQLSLVSPPTEYDLFLAGGPAPDTEFLDGMELFLELGCANCHNGLSTSDLSFHRTGVPVGRLSRPFQAGIDIGRQELTGRASDRFRFRTAPLREVAHTAPYMHNGSLATLEDVVLFYTSGENPLAEHAPEVTMDQLERGTPRALQEGEVAALVRFLHGMSSSEGVIEQLFPEPESVPSGLDVSAVPLDERQENSQPDENVSP